MSIDPYPRNALVGLYKPPQRQSILEDLLGLSTLGLPTRDPWAATQAPTVTTPDEYLRMILQREALPQAFYSPAIPVLAAMRPIIQEWAGVKLLSLTTSGSYAKGTANRSGTDVDLFISLSNDTQETLEEVYNKLDGRMLEKGYVTRRQNVSIGVTVEGQRVDLVPAKCQNLLTGDHSLYRRKAGTWTKTNVQTHANTVMYCGRLEEIRILKLWRNQAGLDFPSFYLELTVIAALSPTLLGSAPFGAVADNVWRVLQYLKDNFSSARVIDPANTNNIISDDLTTAEKAAVQRQATVALSAQNWNQIVR